MVCSDWYPFGRGIRIKTLAQDRILGRNPHRATASVAVITVPGLNTHFFFEICFRNRLVAVQGH